MEEDCSTGVVPLQRVLGLGMDLETVQSGQNVTVLWYNGKKYPASFLLSGNCKAFTCNMFILKGCMLGSLLSCIAHSQGVCKFCHILFKAQSPFVNWNLYSKFM